MDGCSSRKDERVPSLLKMGGARESMVVRLLDEQHRFHQQLAAFNAACARCYHDSDRQRLLAVIEAAFGTFEPFNEIVRNVFAEASAKVRKKRVIGRLSVLLKARKQHVFGRLSARLSRLRSRGSSRRATAEQAEASESSKTQRKRWRNLAALYSGTAAPETDSAPNSPSDKV